MRRLLLIIMLIASAMTHVKAQTDNEYRMEIGAGAGLAGYLGDFNGTLTKDLSPMFSVMGRYIFNPYMALRLGVGMTKMKGSSADAGTYYPDYASETYEFNNSLVDVSVTYEYNFWPYGTGRDYRGAQRLTPYIFGGFGVTSVTGDNSAFTANIPLGLGVKYKLGERVNVGLEWAMHFSLSDKLDGVKDPYTVKSSGAFKNTDCYSALQLTLTYSFMAKCRTCHNADD